MGDEAALKYLSTAPPRLSLDPSIYMPEIGTGRPPRIRELSDRERAVVNRNDPRLIADPRDPAAPPIAIRENGTVRATSYFGGDATARQEFVALARGMGRLLPSMPREYTQIVPAGVIWHAAGQPRKVGPLLVAGTRADPHSEGREQGRWIESMFEIAWQKLPGSPLRAKRLTWEGNATFPYDPDELQILRETGFMSEILKDVPALPNHFFSELPLNAFSRRCWRSTRCSTSTPLASATPEAC